MRDMKMKSIFTVFLSITLATQVSAATSCKSIRDEIDYINNKQNQLEVKVGTENMTLEQAKKARDSELAKAMAMQALLDIKNDYFDYVKDVANNDFRSIMGDSALEVLDKAEENMQKVVKFSLLHNTLKEMRTHQSTDVLNELKAKPGNAYFSDAWGADRDLYDYIDECKSRSGGISDNFDKLSKGLEGKQLEEHNLAKTEELRTHKIACDNSKKILSDIDKLSDDSRFKVEETINSYGKLMQKVHDLDSSSLKDELDRHYNLITDLNSVKFDANGNKEITKDKKAFNLLTSQYDHFSKHYDNVKAGNDTILSEAAKMKPELRVFKNKKDFNSISKGINAIKQICSKTALSDCGLLAKSNNETLNDFKEQLKALSETVGIDLNEDKIFDFEKKKKKQDKLNADTNKRIQKFKDKLKALQARSGILKDKSENMADEDAVAYSELSEVAKELGCNGTISKKGSIDLLKNNSTLEKCLKHIENGVGAGEAIKAYSENVKKYDDAISKAMRADKEFKDYEHLKHITVMAYTTSCGTANTKERKISLIDYDQSCMKDSFSRNPAVEGLFEKTSDAVSELIAEDYIRHLSDDGNKDFVSDRGTWMKLNSKYCKEVDNESCTDEDPSKRPKMCTTCNYVKSHKENLFKYNQTRKNRRLPKGQYIEWDSSTQKMVRKKHPVSNLYAHTAMYISKNLGGILGPRASLWGFKSNLIQQENNAKFMKQQYHWQAQMQERIDLSNPALFGNFYGTTPTMMGFPVY